MSELITNCTARLPGDLAKHPDQPKRNKYNAVKVKMDGYVFDSKAEAKRYTELKLLELATKITGLIVHPEFLLQQAAQISLHVIRPIIYEADFAYWENSVIVIEDVKGVETKQWVDRWKLVQVKFPEYQFRTVKA